MDEPYFKANEDNQSPYVEIYEDAFSRAELREDDDRTYEDYVGAYYGWSWVEFTQTPVPIVRKLKAKLDKKFENMEDEVFSYQYLAVIMALAKAFGGSK